MALQDDIQQGVAELRNLLSPHSTLSVAGWCFGPIITAQQEETDRRLHSPDRQISFLLGLLLSTPEPEAPTDFTENDWRRTTTLLNVVSSAYFQLYFPRADERGNITAEWRRVREVASNVFLHYFNTGLVASVEQLAERVAAYVAGFDNNLNSLIGIAPTDAIAICRFITCRLQHDLNGLHVAASEAKARRQTLLERAEAEGCSFENLIRAEWNESWAERAREVLDGVQRLGLVTLKELEAEFPRTAHSYWKRFTIARGEGPEIHYPTEQSVFDIRPLIRIDDGTAFCPAANSLFSAVLKTAEEALAGSGFRQKFLRARDKALESQVARHARGLLGPDATIWEQVYETPDSQYEHDVIAWDKHVCIIFEAKASPRSIPFRDPEKAFTRIRDAFRGDTGIQKAYEQGNRIVRRLKEGEVVRLFDTTGNEIGQLLPSASEFVACACITRDDFGPLATNLSLLLQKSPEDAFPWAMNIVDLSTLAEAWSYFKWGSLELRNYLDQRLKLHGVVFSAYELDFAGSFIQHGGFSAIQKDGAIVQLGPDYSDVFDDIYRHRYHGGPPVQITRKKPVLTDLKRSLALGQPVFVDSIENLIKVGRNERCPCGSGKKYKKCCAA